MPRKPDPDRDPPDTGNTPAMGVYLSPPAYHTLRLLAQSATLSETALLRELLRAEEARRYTRGKPSPLPYAALPTPAPPHPKRNRSYRFTRDDLQRIARLLSHCLTHEGIPCDRSGLLTRLIHEEYRRTRA